MFTRNYVFYMQNPLDHFDLAEHQEFTNKIAKETLKDFKVFCWNGLMKNFKEFDCRDIINDFFFYVPWDIETNIGYCCKIENNWNTYVIMPELTRHYEFVLEYEQKNNGERL